MWLSIPLLALAFSLTTILGAASLAEEEPIKLPPGKLPQPKTSTQYLCKRKFLYRDQTLLCDSFTEKDGEKLRDILKDVPDALSELNLYQDTRRGVRNLAYLESLGLALTIAGLFISPPPIQDGHVRRGGYFVLSGLGIAGGTFLYGLSLNRANEGRLERAVDIYNRARPEDPIVLQFSTGLSF